MKGFVARLLLPASEDPLPWSPQPTQKRGAPAFPQRTVSWPRGWAGAAITVAVLVPIAVWAWVSFETRTQTLNAAEVEQRRIAEALGQQARGLFDAQVRILDLVDRQAGERDCRTLRADTTLRDFLAVAMRGSARSEATWVIDSDGFICGSSNPVFIDRNSRRSREYFGGARDAGFNHYYVSRAFTGLIAARPIFTMAKPRVKDGAFNGVILVSIDIDQLTRNWQETLRPIPSQRMAVYRRDGAVIARSWEPLAPEPDDATEGRVAAMWLTAQEGGTTGVSPIDRQMRVAGWHSLPDWGVAVTSRVDAAEVLRPWRQSMVIYGAVAALISLMFGGFIWWLLRGQQTLAWTVEERTRTLRTITDAMPQMVWSTRPDGYHDYYNERWYERTGTTPEQVMGDGRKSVFHPDDRERAWARWQHSIATGEPFEMEYRLHMADGSTRWTLGRALPVRDPATGAITRWFGTCTDLEDVVNAREAMARSREDLERLVTERTHDLEAALARVAHAERMQALGQLAGGIAHDFNNVLQMVEGAGSLIERRSFDETAVRRLARVVMEAAGRGASITRRLLAFGRRGDLRAEPLDIATVLTGMQDILGHSIGAAIRVEVHLAEDAPPIFADKGQLETALVNLATNARDAMPGGGRLMLTAGLEIVPAEGALHPFGLTPGRYVRLTVADTGLGMDAATLARATEPFFTTKEVGAGTGLGLPMVRGFVEQSGGKLDIASSPGTGTTVSLYLPAAEDAAIAAATTPREAGEAPAPGPAATVAARILLVDDEDLLREVLAEQLEDAGYEVQMAANGANALALLAADERVDALITDLSMPGMDGLAVIRAVQHVRPGLPTVLLTGFAGESAAIAADAATTGSFSLLRKPVRLRDLTDRLQSLLAARRNAGQQNT